MQLDAIATVRFLGIYSLSGVGYPHTVHGGELHGDVEVFDPERGGLQRDSNDLPDAVCLGIHPNVAEEQPLFIAFGDDV